MTCRIHETQQRSFAAACDSVSQAMFDAVTCALVRQVASLSQAKSAAVALAMLTALLAAGCQAFVVEIRPDPMEASVVVRDASGGIVTPISSRTHRYQLNYYHPRDAFDVNVSRDGYQSVTQTLDVEAAGTLDKQERSLTRTLPVTLPLAFRVRFVIHPYDASWTLVDPDGQAVTPVGEEGRSAVATLTLAHRDASYTLTAERSQYQPRTMEINEAMLRRYELDASGVREIPVTLESDQFAESRRLAVVFDPKLGFVGKVSPQRAYFDENGAAGRPSRVYDLSQYLGVTNMSISPDGGKLVFAEAAMPGTWSLARQALCEPVEFLYTSLRAIDINTGEEIGLTRPGYVDLDPSYTPDGEHLLFASTRYRPDVSHVLRISTTGKRGVQTIYRDLRQKPAVRPTMNNDGTVVFTLLPSAAAPEARPEIWTTGGANRYETFLTIGNHAVISPDGAHIAYIGDDDNLFVIQTDGSEPRQLTDQASVVRQQMTDSLPPAQRVCVGRHPELSMPYAHPAWTPDSKSIVFESRENRDPTGRPNSDIRQVNIETGAVKSLTTNYSADLFPVVSPDGKHLYFISNRGNRWSIHQMPLAGE